MNFKVEINFHITKVIHLNELLMKTLLYYSLDLGIIQHQKTKCKIRFSLVILWYLQV